MVSLYRESGILWEACISFHKHSLRETVEGMVGLVLSNFSKQRESSEHIYQIPRAFTRIHSGTRWRET